jgi:hypothetical protein
VGLQHHTRGTVMSGSLIGRKPEQGCLSPKKGNGCGGSDDLVSFWRALVPGGGQMAWRAIVEVFGALGQKERHAQKRAEEGAGGTFMPRVGG